MNEAFLRFRGGGGNTVPRHVLLKGALIFFNFMVAPIASSLFYDAQKRFVSGGGNTTYYTPLLKGALITSFSSQAPAAGPYNNFDLSLRR